MNLSFNKFKQIPNCIIEKRPNILNFKKNSINILPPDLFRESGSESSTNFRSIDFSNCDLSVIPETISNVDFFEINLSDNRILSLPENFGKNNKISRLYLSNNPINSLPENFFANNLQIFAINNTEIEFLPKINQINELYLYNTKITEFHDLTSMINKNMFVLDINKTNIEKIPDYVKSINIENVYVSDQSTIDKFSNKSKIFVNQKTDYEKRRENIKIYQYAE